MKYLLSFVVLLLGFMWWKSQRAQRLKDREQAKVKPGVDPRANAGAVTPIEMASCAKCGLHLPQADVIEAHGRVFCSKEHARGA